MTFGVRAFVESLLVVIWTQQARISELEAKAAELERRLGTPPQNSSSLPSRQHPHAKTKPRKKPSGKKRGDQPGHNRHQRTLVPPEQVTKTIRLKPPTVLAMWGSPYRRRPGTAAASGLRIAGGLANPHRVPAASIDVPVLRSQNHGPVARGSERLAAFAVLLMAYFRQGKRRTA